MAERQSDVVVAGRQIVLSDGTVGIRIEQQLVARPALLERGEASSVRPSSSRSKPILLCVVASRPLPDDDRRAQWD
jgi:hypothetical protein